ncbi:Sphingomyelin phosphodiesterase [Pelomyxa schiedti]|nr:Sphingomyelin phosphodiesterase [Pelomyxa schiedti]
MTDPAGQFEWLEQTLGLAERSHEKVLLIGHVPPGHDLREKFNEIFVRIFQRWSHILLPSIFGHKHLDSFRLVFNENDSAPCGVALIGPSVAPSGSPHNPAYRVYRFDSDTVQLDTFETYYCDIDKSNFLERVEYSLEYSAKVEYHAPAITAQSMYEVWLNASRSDRDLLRYCRKYASLYTGLGYEGTLAECTAHQLCSMRYVDHKKLASCLAISDSHP